MTNSVNYRVPGIESTSRTGSSAGTDAASDPSASAESEEETCECGHPLARHDAIASRYCGVTIAGSLTRGCVCDAH
jgi:hypothetical protein